jgi:hypothetical protein
MANFTKGQGQAPPSGLPPHGGTETPVPPTPLGNFSGLVLRIALGATRGDAELEGDWERFGCQWRKQRGTRGFDVGAQHAAPIHIAQPYPRSRPGFALPIHPLLQRESNRNADSAWNRDVSTVGWFEAGSFDC